VVVEITEKMLFLPIMENQVPLILVEVVLDLHIMDSMVHQVLAVLVSFLYVILHNKYKEGII
jgi:hypothetical protein